jgi:hypothetical protein
MLFLDVNEKEMENAEKLQEMIDNKKNVFVLVYMIGCTPCKNTLPEWNKLKGCKEMEQFKNNDDIIVANVEQSMCEKMHHKDLENIMSFPTIKHIQHNDVHDYNDERSTSAFSKWIKSLIKKNGKLKDVNHLVIKNQDKTNHGNIDMLMKPRFTKKRRKTSRSKPVRKKKAKSIKKMRKIDKQSKQYKNTNTNTKKAKKINKFKKNKSKSKSKSKSNSRRLFQKPLSFTKSLPI